MIAFKQHGNFSVTEKLLKKGLKPNYEKILARYGVDGVKLLADATPVDSGETAKGWSYRIVKGNKKVFVSWTNSNMVGDVSVAILIQYGHATGSGGYVMANDFINPVMKSVFDQMANAAWKEVTIL